MKTRDEHEPSPDMASTWLDSRVTHKVRVKLNSRCTLCVTCNQPFESHFAQKILQECAILARKCANGVEVSHETHSDRSVRCSLCVTYLKSAIQELFWSKDTAFRFKNAAIVAKLVRKWADRVKVTHKTHSDRSIRCILCVTYL
jgi:hypothetical protein